MDEENDGPVQCSLPVAIAVRNDDTHRTENKKKKRLRIEQVGTTKDRQLAVVGLFLCLLEWDGDPYIDINNRRSE